MSLLWPFMRPGVSCVRGDSCFRRLSASCRFSGVKQWPLDPDRFLLSFFSFLDVPSLSVSAFAPAALFSGAGAMTKKGRPLWIQFLILVDDLEGGMLTSLI